MKKMNKIITIILSIVMTMSFTLVGNAEVISGKTVCETDALIPIGATGLDLNPESQSVSQTLSADSLEYIKEFTYNPEVDCNINFQIIKNGSGDKHKGNGTYTISVKKGTEDIGTITEEEAKSYELKGKTTYTFTVKRTYSSPVRDVYIGITAKINPEPITEGFNVSYRGDKDISKYYTFTPSHDGGYWFNLSPFNDCTGTNKNYLLTIYSKIGSSVNEFASYEKGESLSNMRLYLKAGVEYIVQVQGFGANGLGYEFSVETVPVGPSLSLVGAPSLVLNTETACTLYPFANRQAFVWYSFTAPKDGIYEFTINNKYDVGKTGDIIVEIRDSAFAPTQDEDIVYVFENETGKVSKALKEGEICYIQVAEQYKGSLEDVYNVGVTVKEHEHSNEIVIDGNYVIKGCSCQNEESMEYAFWVDSVKLKNATYTGKNVSPKVSIGIMESYCQEGKTIPGIPQSAYTVTVTSKNKKAVGPAKAKVKFIGEYKGLGTYNVSFKIVPKGTTLSKISSGKKAFTAKWKKQASNTSGYEIRYSLYSGMYNAKTVSVGSNKTLSKKISNLKSNTDYYVQVRTYKTIKGKKYCSSWSVNKKVTTK